jgi:Ca2+-binding RTX toxin-like protein
MVMGRLFRPLGSLVIGVGALLVMPGLASASDVTLKGGALVVTDPAGVGRNTQIELGGGGNVYQVDEAAPMSTPAGSGCNLVMGGNAVRCPAAGVNRILVDTGAGNDIVQIQLSVPANVRSVIRGDGGDDTLEGGQGQDKITGGPGGDQMVGNGNVDTVTYAGVARPIRAQIGGGFVSGSVLDGPAGSRDQIVADIENLIGGNKHNKLFGSNQDNTLVGGPKQDVLKGRGGKDQVLGKGGPDYVIGGDGGDKLNGGGDRDKIIGGNGIDHLFALDGSVDAAISCGSGNNAQESAKIDPGIDPAPISC